jgi:hypothetical protein
LLNIVLQGFQVLQPLSANKSLPAGHIGSSKLKIACPRAVTFIIDQVLDESRENMWLEGHFIALADLHSIAAMAFRFQR